MILASNEGNSMVKKYNDFNNSTDSDLALDKLYPDVFGANQIMIKIEFFCFLATLFCLFFSHCKFESRVCRICAAISFVLSSVWMNFAFLFIYGSNDFNEHMELNYEYVEGVKQKNDPNDQVDNNLYDFVTTWRILYQMRKILFIAIIPVEIIYIILFRKFIAQKKDEVEKLKLVEMRKIYEELEQSQL